MTPEAGGKLKTDLRKRAQHLGFDAFGITPARDHPDLPLALTHALQNEWHAGMDWLCKTAKRRSDPLSLWAEVKSIVMLGLNYTPDTDPLADLKQSSKGNISVYARNRDYHDVIKGRLKELAGLLARRSGGEVKVFVDTAPVMEKPLAQAAGLGWQGKHSVLVSRSSGSWLFLGAIFTDVVLPPDKALKDSCGTCTSCLDICPTNAFPAPYKLDARKCLAYYNNEHHGPIPEEFRRPMGNRIFGCDDCLAVCPWNKFARKTAELKLAARPELQLPPLGDLVLLDDAGFRKMFSGSPVKRLGHARFMRNVLIALGNSQNSDLLGHAVENLKHPNPLIRGMAVWAVGQLAPPREFIDLRDQYGVGESNSDVAGEWQVPQKRQTAQN